MFKLYHHFIGQIFLVYKIILTNRNTNSFNIISWKATLMNYNIILNALMIGAGKAAENGILFKGGEYLEIAKKIKTMVFDKTGTLTKGRPEVTDIIVIDKKENEDDKYHDNNENKNNKTKTTISENELLRLAAIAESGSEHPLGEAIVRRSKDPDLGRVSIHNPDSFQSISGHGLRATYGNHVILIGNRRLMKDNGIFTNHEKEEEFIDSKLNKL
jgi:P-type Cu+ transporter